MNDRSLSSESAPQNWDALKIAGLYLLTGSLWILFSDQLALMLTRDPVLLNRISLFKGWGYIVVTALLLYWLIQRYTAGLSQSEARYRSLFQNNHSVILLIDPKSGRIVDANSSACAFYGYTHSEITGLEITAVNQLRREQVFVEMEQSRHEQRRQFLFRHRLANGDIREVEVYSGPIEVQGQELLYSIVHDITARQQAETALHESEEKYRTLLESLADGVFVAQDYRFVFANSALPAMLGYNHEALVDLPFEAVIAPEFLPVWTERFTQRISSGPEPLKRYEARFLCNGGERSLWVELRASRIEYQGRPAVMGIIHDITERKQTQEALRENEERLRLALTAANQGLYDLNIQSGEAQVSPEYVTMLGYDPATFHETNAAWIERLHPDDRQPVADHYRAYIAGEVPAYTVEFRQRTQGGDWKWILSMGKIVAWDSEGRPLRMLGTHTDIHERKQAEQQLRYQANLLQNVSDAIIATDANFKITSWNRAAEAIYGWSAAEVMGLSTTDLFQVEYNKFPPEQIDQDFQAQGFWQGEVTQKVRAGPPSRLWLRFH
ncbi:MAG: PAS domain S-box protein [Anaerolineales bacterium]|nr:PAS domain S-box protein [Anaerolineales bacterium]